MKGSRTKFDDLQGGGGKSVNVGTLSDRVYRSIKSSIINNHFLPGEKLSITFLSSSLGVSQTPVREALGRLSADGLIDYEPHKRPRVSEITEEEVHQVYEIRRLLEPHATELVIGTMAQNRDIKDSLETLLKRAEDICQSKLGDVDIDTYLSIDLELYDILLSISGETLFGDVLAFVGDRSIRIRTFLEAGSEELAQRVIHEITQEHLHIIQALLHQNKPEALKYVAQHLNNGEVRTMAALTKRMAI